MQIHFKIGQINYADVAVKALPVLQGRLANQDSAVVKIVNALAQLPSELIHEMFHAIPLAEKNEIVVALAREHKAWILSKANEMARKNGIGITIRDLTVTGELEFRGIVEEIDYRSIVLKFLPLVRKKLASIGEVPALLRPMLAKASPEQILGILDRIPQGIKDEIVISLLNQYQDQLREQIVKLARDNGIALTVEALEIRA